MSFKKSFLFLTLLLAWVSAFSQQTASRSFELQWNEESQFPIRGEKTLTLPIVDGQFFGPDGVPTFTTSFNVQNNTIVREFQIKNVKFSNLPNSALKDLPVNRLPKDLNAELKMTRIREQSVAVLMLHPLLQQNGQAVKLLSFTLEYRLGNYQETAIASRSQNMSYTNRSVLAQGTWHKFRVDTTGVFRIGRAELQEIGVSTTGLDPADIRIFGNGGRMLPQANGAERIDDLRENALFVYGGEDGSFDEGDYVLFYAIGPHSWDIRQESFRLSEHRTNIYSDHAYYFLTVDNGKGQRIGLAEPPDAAVDATINTYQDFLLHETEALNLFANGQQWMGEDFSFEDTQTFDFNIPDLDLSQDITIRMRGAAISFSDTRMRARVNGQEALLLQYNALSNSSFALASTDMDSREVGVSQEQIRVEVSFENGGNPSSRGYLDYIELIGTRKLIARGRQYSFRNVNASNASLLYEYRIQNAAATAQVWDVSDPQQPRILPDVDNGSDYVFRVFGGTNKEFVLVDQEDLYRVEAMGDNLLKNQNLHGLQDVDYLIISPDYLMSEAERLADHHRLRSGWNAQVVDLQAVYNEFASGSPDLTAIRDFVRFLYRTASSPAKRIRYLCLFGDASFDFKDRISDNNNVVPAFQSYESFNLVTSFVTDDYFGMMDENEGELGSDDMQDVATGRYPVTSLSQAREAVDKTLQYYQPSSLGDWRNTVTFVADDPDTPNEFVLQETVDQIARELEKEKPSLNLKKIYADAHQQESSAGGERYPTVNEAIDNAVESGSLVLDYFGHGGVNGWANERILEVPQIQNWYNFNTLPLFITVTCEFARFDNPIRPTAGEYTFLNSKGGAVSMIATSREIFIGVGQVFNSTLMQNLFGFGNGSGTISEALMHTKNEFRSVQRLFVYNFGDPAMQLAQARPDIRITRINDKDVEQSRDTLKALSRMRLEGVVTDGQGQIAADFNGTLTATIYDKPLDKTTLDNDNFGRTMPFTSIESKIFRGRASVSNGSFAFDFIVPKDIRIAFGKAKISLYAEDQELDHTGADLSVTIGGIDPNAPIDTEGPTIRLFMNDESFVDGGNTSESPLLYALLEDPSGINTSITAVDHDITAILDEDNANPYVLNDYYETELDDFRKGKVKFPMRDLEPGLHTIKFKCWDTYNNPSESALSFIVVNDNDLILSNVLNYPNPFVNYTEFWFNHNKPNETLEVQVQIFTVSGKLIRTLNRSVQSEGLLSREITWDGLDDFGNKIGKGVYIYKLHVRSPLSNAKAEKFEKLVILQ